MRLAAAVAATLPVAVTALPAAAADVSGKHRMFFELCNQPVSCDGAEHGIAPTR